MRLDTREREREERKDMKNIELSLFSNYSYQINYKIHMFTI